ncbi:hypothetical protein DL237_01760 [Pseudooceanicola sediminis]|uniref:Uncharacterized protein n=1 Tax=Pseudooceanicola sediminis TaxID=2211117 RepID=A0A399J979_9RHOB|nr:thioredoxin domain-containing protein [Pseudooceanicola sediminis]KAA2316784.1 thioredoxin domain-containing protein [Puniceibacterium sp. HSS470]RII40759.1 hypothetical protein DL237_01760 [Pseudooceanicola sediminis]|tara:strand:+ start:240820 stop:241557 length:738 start_codon:yes stop_codon:yes gene_type:complete
MRWPLFVLLGAVGLPGSTNAEPFRDALADNPYLLNEELRMLLHDEPDILASALAHGADLRNQAVWSPLQNEIETDLSRIAELSDDLFSQTHQGFGAQESARITLFTQLACAKCARAEAELRELADQHPDLRVELRSRSTALPDRLSYVIARDLGAQACARFRDAVNSSANTDEAHLMALIDQQGLDAQTLRRSAESPETMDALKAQVRMFNTLGLDTAPSYVMPRMLIRGHMPSVVLARYLARRP